MRGLFLPVIILLISLISCNENACEEPTDVGLQIGFYQVIDEQETDSLVINLTIYGIGREDSLIYNQGVAQSITLPLSQVSDTSRFVFRIDDTQDTCSVVYMRFVTLISHDCGFITEFNLLNFNHTHVHIDSAVIVKPNVTNFEEEHIKIYL